jgi:surfactin synthase thioesterase subunit
MTLPRFRTIHQSAAPQADVLWINHAGGTTNALAHRAGFLSGDLPIRLWTPWMPAREQFSDQGFDGGLEEMARALVDLVVAERSAQATPAPLVLVGHSFGSVIAYRIACGLAARAIPVHRLVVLAFPSPENLQHEKELGALDDEQLIAQVDAQFGGIPQSIGDDADIQTYFVRALRLDVGLLAGYEHAADVPPLPIPIVAICGTDDPSVDVADMQRWQKMSGLPLRLRSMPGDHFFPLKRMPEILDAALWDVLPG